jgi:ribonuclease D
MRIITTSEALKETCVEFAEHDFVTVDTEFMREKTFYPKLCLIQMACDTDEVIIDPQADGLDLEPFFDLMGDTGIVKVFHSARQDIEIMHYMGDVIPKPLFDTQVAAMVCGFGDSVGYENLVRKLVGAKIDKTSRFTDWSHRPLSERQLAYAMSDVTHLRKAYTKLKAQLDNTGRESWLAEEMAVLESPDTYRSDPKDAWKRLKFRARKQRNLAAFMAAAAWREREAQSRDVPRNRVLKDEALSEIATQLPKEPGDFRRLRAVPRGFGESQQAFGLLKEIKKALDGPMDHVPDVKYEPVDQTARPTAVIDILKVALKVASERHHVAQKLIASVADLEQIAMNDEADVPALKGWRRELFGGLALQLKHGRMCIAVEGGEAVIVPLSGGGEDMPIAVSAE